MKEELSPTRRFYNSEIEAGRIDIDYTEFLTDLAEGLAGKKAGGNRMDRFY